MAKHLRQKIIYNQTPALRIALYWSDREWKISNLWTHSSKEISKKIAITLGKNLDATISNLIDPVNQQLKASIKREKS